MEISNVLERGPGNLHFSLILFASYHRQKTLLIYELL